MILGTISRLAVRAGLLTFTILLLSGCGGHKHETTAVPDLGIERNAPIAPATVSLDDALAELDAYPCPEGVDEELWTELKGALEEALLEIRSGELQVATPLISRPGGRESVRVVSTPPTGEANKVTDLAIADNGDGTFTLTWSYRNSGDYDQNNTVGISDITPIAMHYGETYEPADENCMAAVVDGSCNCCVDIADITPIAMNYATDCAGYRIQGGNSLEGSFTTIRNVSLDSAIGDGRLCFSEGFTSIAYLYLRVVPYDAQGEDGEPSDAVLVPGDTPEITSVAPLTGLEGESVAFSAEINGTPPFTYLWDFGGGADPDTSNQSNPSVTLGAVGEYEAQLTVASSFGEDVLPFTLTVNPAPPEILSVSPTVGTETAPIQFTAEVTGTEPFTYAWDFGGGVDPDTSDEASPTVTLGSPGEYSASLTATNVAGDDTFPFTLTVTEVEELVADAQPDSPSGMAPLTVDFTGSATGGIPPYTYQWDFTDDGSWDSAEQSPSHIYQTAGDYTCRLRVTDCVGTWDEDTSGIAVSEPPPRGDWWMFGREPTHNGRSPYLGPQTATLKWRYDIGSGPGAAIGGDGTIYVGSGDNYLYALNPDGTLKWRYETGDFTNSVPAIGGDGTIYMGCSSYIYAIKPDGTLKWRYETGLRVDTSPAIGEDGTIYAGSRDSYVYALNPDGGLKWRYKTDAPGLASSPAIGEDGTIYAGSALLDNSIHAINPDGTPKWSYLTGNFVGASPAIGADGTIYVGGADHYIYALNPDGSLKWRYVTGNRVYSGAAIGADGTIYVGSDDYYLYAFNPNGSLKWRYETGNMVQSHPAIGADGTIYVGSRDRYIYALNPNGTLKWRYETGDRVSSNPAIGDDGTLYVGSRDGYLYAFGD